MYETMVAWETMETAGEPPAVKEYAEIWRDADKVVYSRTLGEPSSERTRIEREFDLDAVQAIKHSAKSDVAIGGAELAGQAIAAGLVDECHLILNPVIVGGGKPALPADVMRQLELLDTRTFGNGAVHLHYRLSA